MSNLQSLSQKLYDMITKIYDMIIAKYDMDRHLMLIFIFDNFLKKYDNNSYITFNVDIYFCKLFRI